MKRRDFFQQAGVAAVGLPAAWANAGESSPRVEGNPTTKRVLLTSAHCDVAHTLAARLRNTYRVSLTSPVGRDASPLPIVQSPLDYGETTRALVRGIDAIVHVAQPPAGATESERIDYRTRATYNLLRAAVDEGVQAVVYLSSLDLMTGYDADFAVDEEWQPQPVAGSEALSDYLGEFTCREFAREGRLRVSVLRLGKVVRAGEVSGLWDPLWVDEQDVVQAVSLALAALLARPTPTLGSWSVFHILSASPQARFSVARARRMLGYQPQSNG